MCGSCEIPHIETLGRWFLFAQKKSAQGGKVGIEGKRERLRRKWERGHTKKTEYKKKISERGERGEKYKEKKTCKKSEEYMEEERNLQPNWALSYHTHRSIKATPSSINWAYNEDWTVLKVKPSPNFLWVIAECWAIVIEPKSDTQPGKNHLKSWMLLIGDTHLLSSSP